jgi:ribosomal-protein-alanine N-acetyltransferase
VEVDVIATARFDLVSMDRLTLAALVAGDLETAAARLGAHISADWDVRAETALSIYQGRLAADESWQPWLMRALVRRSDGRMVGHAGFHGPPGMAHLTELAPGGVEVGYTVLQEFRGQGVATEIVDGLMDWAYREHGVPRVVASIAPDNAASLRVVAKLGFHRIGEWQDETDGLEWVFERRLPAEAADREPATKPSPCGGSGG